MLVYLAMGLQSGAWLSFPGAVEVLFGANYAPLVWQGQWFRLLTSAFLHGGALHLGMNMVALHQVGSVIEPYYGRARLVGVYLASAIAASAASLLLHSRPTVSVGASGAIAGLIGAGAVAGQMVGTEGGRAFRNAMLRWAGIIIAFGFAVPGIDNSAHVGGFVAGIASSAALSRGVRRRDPAQGAGTTRETVLATTILLVIVVAAFALAFGAASTLIRSGLLDHRG